MPPNLSKKLLRSLPTLTEVVQSPSRPNTAAPPPAALPLPTPTPSEQELLVQRVLQQLAPIVDSQLQTIVSSALQEQMRELMPGLRQRVDGAVRKAVSQAVAAELKNVLRKP